MQPDTDARRREEIRVVQAIDERQLANAMFEAVRAVPPYSTLSAESVLEEVREHCQEHAHETLRSLEEGRVPGDRDLAFVRENAARRAHQRVPLPALLHAYRVGYAVVWDHIRAELEHEHVSIDAVTALADLCIGYTNAISFAATDAYLLEQQRLLMDQERARTWVLDALLRGEELRGDAEVLLHALRLDARGTVYVLVVGACADDDPAPAPELEPRLASAMAGLAPVLARGDAPALHGISNDRAVALVVRPELDDPAPWIDALTAAAAALADDGLLAFGLSTGWTDLADVPRAYKEAIRAVGLARRDRRFVALSRMSLFEDLLALADATTYRLVPAWANALIEEDRKANGELSSTLLAYASSDLSVGRAATELDVHPNTIRYRLHRIESITGGSLRSYAHLFDILASLRLLARRRA